MPKVHKTITEAGQHLADASTTIGPRYAAATAKADWQGPSASKEAEANYQEGVAESIAAGTRVKGINEAGNSKYQSGCVDKGSKVIGERVRAARSEYEAEFSPVLSAMNEASDRAPRPTRDFRANITNRLVPVVVAARKAAGKPA